LKKIFCFISTYICGWNFAKIGIEIKFLSKEKPSAKSYVSANGLVS